MSIIHDGIRKYLARTHAYAWQLAKKSEKKKPDEPAIVHAFLADEMWPVLQDMVRANLKSQTQALVRGIFTHQTPVVQEVSKSPGCEIADLMLVRMHVPSSGAVDVKGNAVLFQAKHKLEPTTGSLCEDGDAAQFSLYKGWNSFYGTSRLPKHPPVPAINNSPWQFQGKGYDDNWIRTSQYLTVFEGEAFSLIEDFDPAVSPVADSNAHPQLVENGWPNKCPWSAGPVLPQATPSDGVECSTDFAILLADFMEGKVGRGFNTSHIASTDHWSIFVRKMLEIACLRNYKFGKARLPRTQVANISTYALVLPMVAQQEVEDYLFGPARTSFSFINNGLNHCGPHFKSEHGIPDIPGEADETALPRPGHVPILLIVTYGEEPQFR